MARFLSAEWFADIAGSGHPEPATPATAPESEPAEGSLVLERVVRGTPEGEVRYRVIISAGTAHIEPVPTGGNGAAADLTIASDWATATDLAQGRLSAQAALMGGRLRIRGNLARIARWSSSLSGLDPVPADVRQRTTY